MLVVEEMGGFTSGGVNFDAKTHRTSTDINDIVRAHILGMDSYAAALFIARAFNRDPRIKKILSERYETFESRAGVEFSNGKISLAQLASIAKDQGEPALRSGHLEAIEKILQEHILMAGYYALKDSLALPASSASSANPFAKEGNFFIADVDNDGRVSIHELASFLSKNGVDGVSIDSAQLHALKIRGNCDTLFRHRRQAAACGFEQGRQRIDGGV